MKERAQASDDASMARTVPGALLDAIPYMLVLSSPLALHLPHVQGLWLFQPAILVDNASARQIAAYQETTDGDALHVEPLVRYLAQ